LVELFLERSNTHRARGRSALGSGGGGAFGRVNCGD